MTGGAGPGGLFAAPVQVAPMVGRTDRHFRFLLRGASRSALLYSEMATAASVVRRPSLLAFDARESPVVLQLAGADPEELGRAARLAAEEGWDGLNLNLGCPSKRAVAGGFGACQLGDPAQAAEAWQAMAEASRLPVSVKCRLGLKGEAGAEAGAEEEANARSLAAILEPFLAAGCRDFAVHARRAWLGGLSPARNRTRPPLDYEAVRRAARLFPEARFVLNGGLGGGAEGLGGAMRQARDLAGVMVGAPFGSALGASLRRTRWPNGTGVSPCPPQRLQARRRSQSACSPASGKRRSGAKRRKAQREQSARSEPGGRGGRGRAAARCLRACTRLFAGRRGAGAWRAALARRRARCPRRGRPAPPRRGGPTPDRRGGQRRRRRPRSRRGRLRPRRCLERRSAGGTGRPRPRRPRLWRCRPIW